MTKKKLCYFGMFVGSTIGGYAPALWGGSLISFSGITCGLIGGVAGIWAGYRLGEYMQI